MVRQPQLSLDTCVSWIEQTDIVCKYSVTYHVWMLQSALSWFITKEFQMVTYLVMNLKEAEIY